MPPTLRRRKPTGLGSVCSTLDVRLHHASTQVYGNHPIRSDPQSTPPTDFGTVALISSLSVRSGKYLRGTPEEGDTKTPTERRSYRKANITAAGSRYEKNFDRTVTFTPTFPQKGTNYSSTGPSAA